MVNLAMKKLAILKYLAKGKFIKWFLVLLGIISIIYFSLLKGKISNSLELNLVSQTPKNNLVSQNPNTNLVYQNQKTNLISQNQKTNLVSQNPKIYLVSQNRKTNLVSQNRKTNVLLLSSIGRSGTSLIGELISSYVGENYFYFFEPFILTSTDEKQAKITLQKLYNCNIIDDVINKTTDVFQIFDILRHDKTEKCATHKFKEIHECMNISDVENLCQKASLIVIKEIRLSVRAIKSLLEDEKLNLKVIYLVRDPRGSIRSAWDLQWPIGPSSICSSLKEDMMDSLALMNLYPSRFMILKYEDFCLQPWKKASEIYDFVKSSNSETTETTHLNNTTNKFKSCFPPEYSNTQNLPIKSPQHSKKKTEKDDHYQYIMNLPLTTVTFLQKHLHMNNSPNNSVGEYEYSTFRETSEVFEYWRTFINETELNAVEKNCEKVITELGHNIFNTINNVRNFSQPLYKEFCS